MLNISTTKQAKIKGQQESCRGDVYACYLEYGDVFTGIYIYILQSHQNVCKKDKHYFFILVWQLYLNKL